MSRWISWVRPSILLRLRRRRVDVEAGSISYSAVTQPLPDPALQAGTADSQQAVQSTTVPPAFNRMEPGAWCV